MTLRVGVFPAAAAYSRPRLLSALEAALPVLVEGRQPGDESGLAAAIVIGSDEELVDRLHAAWIPVLVLGDVARGSSSGTVRFASGAALDARLRGRSLVDDSAALATPVRVGENDVVHADVGGHPVWVFNDDGSAPLERASLAPVELAEDEVLREFLRGGRFLSLLPLIHFLRAVTRELAWQPPPLRAAFLFDDPNLHWTSYGHLRYSELAQHAEAHRYHVAMATIPLDGWFSHPAAVRLFRHHTRALSLLVHGNNHVRHELGRPLGADGARALLVQALRRVAALERRTGLRVARVMAAPHGVCSLEMAEALVATGFEALCITRPYPWLPRPPAEDVLAGWRPADLVAGGLPVLPRERLDQPRDDFVIRAFLDQPVILYGHHQDVRHGLGRLAELAREVNDLGAVQWSSLSAIAESSFERRRDGALLTVRMLSRRVRLRVPEGVEAIAVDRVVSSSDWTKDRLELRRADGSVVRRSGEAGGFAPLQVTHLDGEIELSTLPCRLDTDIVSTPSWRPWPVLRRGMAETRDRLLPLVAGRGAHQR